MTISRIMEKMIAFSDGNIHDIACPLCREKYGNTNGKYKEKEVKDYCNLYSAFAKKMMISLKIFMIRVCASRSKKVINYNGNAAASL